VIRHVVEEYGLRGLLGKYFNESDAGLFLDFAAYAIVTEGNVAQHYSAYAYCHLLFTEGMRMYGDSKLSEFFQNMTDDQSVGFLNSWNGGRSHRERIYMSYDSTNKSSQAGDIEIVEYGQPRSTWGCRYSTTQ